MSLVRTRTGPSLCTAAARRAMARPAPQPPNRRHGFDLSVPNIMRGPEHFGREPAAGALDGRRTAGSTSAGPRRARAWDAPPGLVPRSPARRGALPGARVAMRTPIRSPPTSPTVPLTRERSHACRVGERRPLAGATRAAARHAGSRRRWRDENDATLQRRRARTCSSCATATPSPSSSPPARSASSPTSAAGARRRDSAPPTGPARRARAATSATCWP